MSIVITGATGHLGQLVIGELLDAGVPAGQIVATGRDTAKLAQHSGDEIRCWLAGPEGAS